VGRKGEMEAIACRILNAYEDRCKDLEKLACEFKIMLEKSALKRGSRWVKDEEIVRQLAKILCEAEELLDDIEKERLEAAHVFDRMMAASKECK